MKRTLPMTDEEIARSYRLAADPEAQIQVLAELNAVSRGGIVEILTRRGALNGGAVSRKAAAKARKEEWLELYRAGLNDCEIARRTGVRQTTVLQWRRERGLPRNCGPGRQRKN